MIVYTPDSNKIVHCTYVDLSDRPINKPIHLVQYDNRIPILAVSIYDSGKTYTIPSTAKVNIRFSKPDETFVYNPALGIKSDNSIIYFEITKQMMSLSGAAKAVIEIEMYDSVACSSPISFIVDRNPIQHHSIESTIEFKTAQQYAKEAESWAHGNTGIRIGENTNNSKYWSEQSKDYANSWKGSLLPQGTIRFSQLPISENIAGHMYNINEAFVTDSRFKDGAGYSYPAGTNVYWTQDGKWDCLSGILTREITQSQYDNLSNAEKTNGTIYYILDADNSINNASQNSAGLMSQEDKKKLDEIASGATRVLVDSSLSSTSTNSIQNRVITNALNTEIERAKAQEALKAPITNPTFYGIPRVSTANAGTNSTQIASTAFTQTAISNHNTSSNAHNDIRESITGLTNRLNALADSDDTTFDQLSEIVAYIKLNRSLIENVTTGKVNVGDIIDNLTSSAVNKPLAAKQGKVLKDLITALTSTVENKVDKVSGKGLSTNDYTTIEKNKLSGIASGAEVNVQSDWNITNSSSDAYIKNKPTIPLAVAVKGNMETSYRTGNVNLTAENIGALPLLGGTINGSLIVTGETALQGNLRIKKADSNYGSIINIGDGDYIRISEETDDILTIKAKQININSSNANAIYINGESAARYKKLTQADYNALPNTKNSDNVIYFITD